MFSEAAHFVEPDRIGKMPEIDDWSNTHLAEVADVFAVPFDGGSVVTAFSGLDAGPGEAEAEGVDAELFEELEIGFVASLVVDGMSANVVDGVLALRTQFLHKRGFSKSGGILASEASSIGKFPL